MNKPKFEARGKKQNRGQGMTPDQELKDVLSQSAPPVSEGLGISPEVLNTEGFSTAEVAERHYGIAPPEHQADMGLTATAPFVGMDREWTAEEKAGMNDSLRQYGWKDQSPPLAATADDPKGIEEANLKSPVLAVQIEANDALNKRLAGTEEVFVITHPVSMEDPSGKPLGEGPVTLDVKFSTDFGIGVTPKLIADTVLGNTPSDVSFADIAQYDRTVVEMQFLDQCGQLLSTLKAAHEAIEKNWVPDLPTFLRELTFKLNTIPVTGQLAEFDEGGLSNQSYFPKDLILVVTRVPKAPIPGVHGDMLKRTLELHTLSISGLKRGFKTRERDMTRTLQRFEAHGSRVRMEFGEKCGRVIGKMFEKMARRVCELGVNDNSTVDFMLIEPDPAHTRVTDAWLCRDMWPGELDTVDAEREPTSARGPARVDVHWSGTVERSDKIDAQAQELLDAFVAATRNPYGAP